MKRFAAVLLLAAAPAASAQAPEFNDAHFHLTNNVQEGPDLHTFVSGMMGTRTPRATVFGVPLQQLWSWRTDGDRAPTYYLHSDAPLYYYSFTDAAIAMAYRALPQAEQARLDPMITGFHAADMYAADHIRRVLLTFPGVFSGIGEFTIHKEFVAAKIPGEVASLENPALDRVLDLAAEAGLVVILHNDIDIPFAKGDRPAAYLAGFTAAVKRHPKTTVIWAHMGLGRAVRPPQGHVAAIDALLGDPSLPNFYVDLSWDEAAKFLVATPEAVKETAALLERHPDRVLFGSDSAAPRDAEAYRKVYGQYAPLWQALTPATSEKVRLRNYERLFDKARLDVRAWEAAQSLKR